MDWIRLLKSIGWTLLLFAIPVTLVFIIIIGGTYPWVFAVVILVALFAYIVDKIYHHANI